jgi:hypothetical protein
MDNTELREPFFPTKMGSISFEGTMSKGFQVVGNFPDDLDPLFPVITYQPYLSQLIQYFRPTDYAMIAGFTFIPSGAFVLWERHRPSISYRLLPRTLMIQIPFYFAVGLECAMKQSAGTCIF